MGLGFHFACLFHFLFITFCLSLLASFHGRLSVSVLWLVVGGEQWVEGRAAELLTTGLQSFKEAFRCLQVDSRGDRESGSAVM